MENGILCGCKIWHFYFRQSVFFGFQIYRESQLQVRVKAFNLFNHPQLTPSSSTPNTQVGGGTFGYITAFGATRSLQFSGRFNF